MGGSRILVVDDEKVIADSLATIFEKQGYQSRATYSAERALETIGQWRPNLAILDVILPGMSGIDLAILIKSEYPDVAVVLMSGQPATTALAENAAQLGYPFKIHAKPVPIPDMLSDVSQLLSAQ